MKSMDVLLIGGGGREAALAKKLAESKRINKLYAAPGNRNIAQYGSCFPVAATDLEGIVSLAKTLAVDLVFVAPDDPLAMGLVDRLESLGIAAFGPKAKAAQLEASKSFAKELMRQMRIPTAQSEVFHSYEEAVAYAKTCPLPHVVKADGLALGKGVVICHTREDLLEACEQMMKDAIHGEAGKTLLFETFLVGQEFTLMAFTDGLSYSLMPTAQDHKQAYDNDLGPNTGGMGAISPGIELHPDELRVIEEEIVRPTLEGLRLRGIDYRGVIYFGLMKTADGVKVIEYNARFGDPECQTLMPLLETDLLEIVQAIVNQRLANINISWKKEATACVVLASGGYPGAYEKGYEITGLQDVLYADVYEAGTVAGTNGQVLTAGGRVLAVVASAPTVTEAIEVCYREADKIDFRDKMLRRDIGRRKPILE